jgi:RNA polymerase sigma factor (sigma-70 family)
MTGGAGVLPGTACGPASPTRSGVDCDQVLGQYRGWLRAVAAGLLTDVELRQDLCQEGWIAMWRALSTFDPAKGALSAWLTYRAYRRMLDCARDRAWLGRPARHQGRTAVRAVTELPAASDAEIWERLTTTDALDGVILAYHRGAILDAVNRLSPAQRRYVYARFWQGMGTAELTAEFGYDPHALWSSPRNGARGKLRRDLQALR